MLSAKRIAPPILALGLLGGMSLETLTHVSPERAAPYHENILEVAETIPVDYDGWTGEDTPIQTQAQELLKPNLLISRRYESESGSSAMLLIVQSKDARDMGGHYPPICYPRSGWEELESPRDTTIALGNTWVPVREYTYGLSAASDRARRILDFFVLHPVGPVREQRFVRRQAEDYQLRHYGAAQIQVIIDGPVHVADRERIFRDLLTPWLPVIEAIEAAGEGS